MVQRLVKLNLLEEIGGVKTARREAGSILLARALLKNRRVQVKDEKRMLKLVQKNKVLLRAADLLLIPRDVVDDAKKDVAEAFDLYDQMSDVFTKHGVHFVAIKSFDSLPDVGHDIDLLVPSAEQLSLAERFLVDEYKVLPQGLTHCDRLLGKFSCFLPGYNHDFNLNQTISHFGYFLLELAEVIRKRRRVGSEVGEVGPTSVFGEA